MRDTFNDVSVVLGADSKNGLLSGIRGQQYQILVNTNYDFDACRPWRHTDGKTYVTVRSPVSGLRENVQLYNADSTMTFEAWRTWDSTLIEAYKERLGFVKYLLSKRLTHEVNAMTTMVVSWQNESDITPAEVVWDTLARSQRDRPIYGSESIPIPLFIKDFGFGMRELSIAQAAGNQLDARTGKLAARRIAELEESVALGNVSALTYNSFSGTVYGLRTHPGRATKVLTNPTANGWTPETTYNEVIDMMNTLRLNLCHGPYTMFISANWSPYLNLDYSAAYPNATLRKKFGEMDGIGDIVPLDKLTGSGGAAYQIILAQVESTRMDVIVGMRPRLIQWGSPDGSEKSFRWISSIIPRFYRDRAGNTNICHGSA